MSFMRRMPEKPRSPSMVPLSLGSPRQLVNPASGLLLACSKPQLVRWINPTTRLSFSMGVVLAEGSERETIIYTDIDHERLAQVRAILPSLTHRRPNLYHN